MPLKVANTPGKGFALCFWLGFFLHPELGQKKESSRNEKSCQVSVRTARLMLGENPHRGLCVALLCWTGKGGDVGTSSGAEYRPGTGLSLAAGSSERSQAGKTPPVSEPPSLCKRFC